MADPLILSIDRLATPIGELLIVADRGGKLRVIDWTDYEDRMLLLLRRHYGEGGYTLKAARDPGGLTSAMRAYFKGDLGVLDRLSVATAGTLFQRDVWRALRKIKCGTTISYAELARRPASSSNASKIPKVCESNRTANQATVPASAATRLCAPARNAATSPSLPGLALSSTNKATLVMISSCWSNGNSSPRAAPSLDSSMGRECAASLHHLLF
jgi:O6-methylguanine-DNA--protein-cysteine methyltransferase